MHVITIYSPPTLQTDSRRIMHAVARKTYHGITALRYATLRVDNKKLSYCWETVRRESMPRIAEMDVEMTT